MMAFVEVISLKWLDAEHTILGGEAKDDILGIIPICIHGNYDTKAGQELWTKANNGEFGKIEDYVAPPDPTPEEKRAAMPPLQKWRVDTAIDLQPGLRDKIASAIEAMPEPERTISKNKLASVAEFYRTDPLFDLIGSNPLIGISPDEIDIMWEDAAAFV